MAGDGELRSDWNKALVEDLAASCYSRVLTAAKDVLGGGEAYEALWPMGRTATGSMWRGLSDSLIRLVKPQPLLESRVNGGIWVTPQNCVVLAAEGVLSDADDLEQLAEVLLADEVQSDTTVYLSGRISLVRRLDNNVSCAGCSILYVWITKSWIGRKWLKVHVHTTYGNHARPAVCEIGLKRFSPIILSKTR